MSDANAIMEMIKENDVSYVDLRFTDPRGKMQHVTQHIDTIDPETLAEGFMFDGSSIAGWKAINESDMKLMPDLSRAYIDPFFAQPTVALFCDVLDPMTDEAYERDPRGTAKQRHFHTFRNPAAPSNDEHRSWRRGRSLAWSKSHVRTASLSS